MDYKITDKSIAAAETYWKTSWNEGNPHNLPKFIKILCVPVEKRWISENGATWKKKNYQLEYMEGRWELWQSEDGKAGLIAKSYQLPFHSSEAQAWADAKIRELEAGELGEPKCENPPIWPIKCSDTTCPYCYPEQPKPFGPGSRLKMPNGDDVLIIRSGYSEYVAPVNLTTNTFGPSTWGEPEEIKKTLLNVGAVLED